MVKVMVMFMVMVMVRFSVRVKVKVRVRAKVRSNRHSIMSPTYILQMTSHPLGHGFETMMEKGQDQIQSTLYFYFSGP
jgi:uncharacterized protein (DUF736 family)